jgi:hypothetical protein
MEAVFASAAANSKTAACPLAPGHTEIWLTNPYPWQAEGEEHYPYVALPDALDRQFSDPQPLDHHVLHLAFAQVSPTETKFANRHLSNRQRPNGDGTERQGAYGCCTKCDHTFTPHGWRPFLGPSYRTVCGHLVLLIIYHFPTSTLSG